MISLSYTDETNNYVILMIMISENDDPQKQKAPRLGAFFRLGEWLRRLHRIQQFLHHSLGSRPQKCLFQQPGKLLPV